MIKTCVVSGKEFEITDEDLKFYEKMGVPAPTLCPEERERRRLAFRNERSLYNRKCDATGEKIISIYSGEKPFPVYCPEYWWSDKWDAKDYGRDFDFSRTFFEQFRELINVVPELSLITNGSENADFNCFITKTKNCYLSQRIGHSQDIYYSYLVVRSKDIVDSRNIADSEMLYEVVDGDGCYNVHFAQNISNCRDSKFLFNCRNCTNCFFCANLRNSEYYFCNEKCTKAEYEKKAEEFYNLSNVQKNKIWQDFLRLKTKQVVPILWGTNNENVTGNYITQCKNNHHCFEGRELEDAAYCWGVFVGKDCWDVSSTYNWEQGYEAVGGVFSTNIKFCVHGMHTHNLEYCINCANDTKDCFGCISLKKSQYCILNKQYSKTDYFELRDKIIEHMKSTKEWGEFFPIKHSPFGYNETIAHEYMPLTQAEAELRGCKWHKSEPSLFVPKTHEIPETIDQTSDDICEKILTCETCPKNYKIQKAELNFYRKMGLPVPTKCPNCRYEERSKLRNPRTLFSRKCDKCNIDIQTTFVPGRPEKVYCEKCYLDAVN